MSLDRSEEAIFQRIAEALERLSLTASNIRGVLAVIASRLQSGGGLTPEQEREERELANSLSTVLKESRQVLQSAIAAAQEKKP